MKQKLSSFVILRALVNPSKTFADLADSEPSALTVLLKYSLWLGVLPPVFAFIGASEYGWRLGTIDPIYMSEHTLMLVSAAYFIALLVGFFSTAVVSSWMSRTYNARSGLGIHLALISIVGAPIVVASVIHLYPNVFINILVLVPAILWSMYLLYRGVPIALDTTPEQGMLMASSIIGYFLVAFVSLLGITVALWALGVGPSLGV